MFYQNRVSYMDENLHYLNVNSKYSLDEVETEADLVEHIINVIWRTLNIEDILSLCKTNSQFRLICQDPATWTYLLHRDYGINYPVDDPRKLYIDLYQMRFIE